MKVVYKDIKNTLFEFKPEVVVNNDIMTIKECTLIKGNDRFTVPKYVTKVSNIWFNPSNPPFTYSESPVTAGSFMVISVDKDTVTVIHHTLTRHDSIETQQEEKNIFIRAYEWIKAKL
jgi:hypothetical protein